MDSNIQIIEKPDWVSWDEIKECLVEAHAANRAKGINMAHYQWPVEKIKDSIGENGVVLIALDGEKVVATAAIVEKFGKTWYANGRYAYMCYAGVLPEYNGRGLYHLLTKKREEIARLKRFETIVFDTHSDNKRIQTIALCNGYRFVRLFRAASKDHYSVVMVKWLNGSPYSSFYCKVRYAVSCLKARMRAIVEDKSFC